jgi:hypothetical protein
MQTRGHHSIQDSRTNPTKSMEPEKSGKFLQSVTEEEAIDVEGLGLSLTDTGDVNSPPAQNKGGSSNRMKQTRPSYYAGYVPKTSSSSSKGATIAAGTTAAPTVDSTKAKSLAVATDTTTSLETDSSSPLSIEETNETAVEIIKEVPIRDTNSNGFPGTYSRQSSLISFSGGDVNDMSSSALAVHADMLLSPEGT